MEEQKLKLVFLFLTLAKGLSKRKQGVQRLEKYFKSLD